ncbi:hypothetical protein RHGRI_014042 [Rhododendron griersonianum]|uniref:Uncharacterized protein n=1 Tax=Rhododendron griersonianum TaxID=479676 RepID=A0AAV6K881_9ERIC|nr:hypothetical protein RHGRI_014042 [Rhododendron griersonianum]
MKPDYQKSHKRGKVGYMVLWLVCEREGGGFKQRRRIEGTNGLSNLDLLLLALARLGIRRMCSKSERGTWLTGSCKRYNVRYPAMYASKSVRKDVKLFNCSQRFEQVESPKFEFNVIWLKLPSFFTSSREIWRRSFPKDHGLLRQPLQTMKNSRVHYICFSISNFESFVQTLEKIYTRKVENKNHLVNLVPSTLYAIVVDE